MTPKVFTDTSETSGPMVSIMAPNAEHKKTLLYRNALENNTDLKVTKSWFDTYNCNRMVFSDEAMTYYNETKRNQWLWS